MVRRKRSRENGVARTATPADQVTVPNGCQTIGSEEAARELAHRLLTPGRRWPVAIITVANGAAHPYADVDALVADLRGLVEVVVMPTSDVSWAFSAVMPPMTQVYGGASRVYPVDHEWVARPRLAPLRFAYSLRERERVTDQLLADGMGAAVAAGLYQPGSASPTRAIVDGTVMGVFGSRALVDLDDGGVATLWEELSGFDVSLDRLVQPGQRLRGRVDPETRRLDVDPVLAPTEPGGHASGSVVLAEVRDLTSEALTVRLQPGLDVEVPRSSVTTNALDSLPSLFSVGDVVVARVADVAPLSLSLLDVDDDEAPEVAPSILAGGPPWLTPPNEPVVAVTPDIVAEDEPNSAAAELGPLDASELGVASAAAPISPVLSAASATAPRPETPPRAGPTPLDVLQGRGRPVAPRTEVVPAPVEGRAVRDLALALETERVRNAELERQIAEARGAVRELAELRRYAEALEEELARSEANVRAFRDKYRLADARRQRLEGDMKSAAAKETRDDDPRDWFTDPLDALELSVKLAWARRTPAGEKAGRPLGSWTAGPRFAQSLSQLGPVSWRKLAEVIADVVVGDPSRLSALEHHELREGTSGNARPVVRDDGAACFRVALQRNAPSARRLHFWRRADHVELSRVVLHDDMAP